MEEEYLDKALKESIVDLANNINNTNPTSKAIIICSMLRIAFNTTESKNN